MRVLRLVFVLVVFAGSALVALPAAAQSNCTPDSGYEWCYTYSYGNCSVTNQVDTNYNSTIVNGYRVAAKDYLMRFKCNGTIYYGDDSNNCGSGGCSGQNLGIGEVTKSIATAYTANAHMYRVNCFRNTGSYWCWGYWNPWDSGVSVVECYNDGHCGCGQRCDVVGGPANWKCVSKAETCNNLDDDCDGQTDEGYPDKGQSCTAGIGECLRTGSRVCNAQGTGTVCNAVAGSPGTEVCDNKDNDCDAATDEALGSTTCGTGECVRTQANCVGGAPQPCVPGAPVTETCDGKDNDCNGTADNGFNVGQACTVGIGECVNAGVLQCSGPNATACSATPKPPVAETCDGRDNDCDGATDDGFPLKGTACTNGVGECSRLGTYVCNGSGSGVICDAVPGAPVAESCNGKDDDCNGVADNGFPVGDACTVGIGECRNGGLFVCDSDPAKVRCDAAPLAPKAEICDALDNDCDGGTDEDFPLKGTVCTNGVGECARTGTWVCAAGGAGLSCNAVPGDPVAERCDALDNDCDAATDEDFPQKGTGCLNGVGECSRPGTWVCNGSGTATVCDAVPGAPVAESCNGKDDDCNGAADNGFPVAQPCKVGVGECENAGAFRCTADAKGVECDVSPLAPTSELCDALDNDCDGVADDDFPLKGTGCSLGVGECARDGTWVCDPKRTGVLCDAVPGQPGFEACNGKDDDCNGADDDGWPLGMPCSVGVGECAAAGGYVCAPSGDAVACDATPLPPSSELCDDRDNDCDGLTDETFPTKGEACGAGIGACFRNGVLRCSLTGTAVACDAVPGPPKPEVCDSVDNDCDGIEDDGFPVGQPCTVGVGECASAGARVCSADGGGTVCDAKPKPPVPEACDALDNDCDGTADNGFPLGAACTNGVGECAAVGKLVCAADHLGTVCDAVPGAPKPESCNGLDDDCDGTPDDGFPLGEACTVGVGECVAAGVRVCAAGGATTVCDATARPPVPERCDALDNDCDGATDEDFPLGAGCEVGIGECVRAGGLVCAADGSGTACDAVPGDPAAEACDGLDNDCDGIADNGFPIGDACTAGTGECVRAGALVCSADGSGTTCDAVPGEPLTDVCNGLDDDCDGVPDGAFDVGAPCTEGQGECEAAGAKVCREDLAGTVCDAVAGAPADEVCNGLDDDCDGETDDGFDLAGPCTVGTGACAAAGEPRCSDDGAGVECEGEPGAASAELCNGVDDDCDGATDEDFVIGEPCEAGVGACHAAGTIVCTADGTGLECGAKAGEPVAELCNGADDDCDGDTDEAFVLGDACSVGLGTCRAEGTLVCTDDGTGTRCSAEPGEPGVLESCDGLDNDCDGGTDEDYDVGAACASGRGACAADGVLACNDAGNGTECTATPGEPADETCNGIDDDCDGETDEAGACAPEPSPDAGDAHEPEPVPEPELPPDPVPEPEPEAASEPRPDLPDESTEGPSPDVPAIDSVGPAPDVAGEGRAGGSGGCNSAHTASAWWLMLLLLAAASVQGMVRTRSADRP